MNLLSQFGKVAVLYGGVSAERDISLKSGNAIYQSLLASGVDVHKIDANPHNIGGLREQEFDRVFLALHGSWGEDGVVQGALQAVGMPFTGSKVLGSALAMDKVRSKQIWLANDLPTAAFRVLSKVEDLPGAIQSLGLPMFIKPAREGSSVGVGKVTDASQLEAVWRNTAELGYEVLAEQFIAGAELTVGILKDRALPVIRMQPAGEFYDYEAKYLSGETQYHCPAGLSDELEQEVRQLALTAFRQLDCCGWGRVDAMLDSDGRPQLLEVNTIPGMTDHSLVPMAAAAAGIDFDALVLRILETTL